MNISVFYFYCFIFFSIIIFIINIYWIKKEFFIWWIYCMYCFWFKVFFCISIGMFVFCVIFNCNVFFIFVFLICFIICRILFKFMSLVMVFIVIYYWFFIFIFILCWCWFLVRDVLFFEILCIDLFFIDCFCCLKILYVWVKLIVFFIVKFEFFYIFCDFGCWIW